MNIVTLENYKEAVEYVEAMIREQVNFKRDSVLGMATGSTFEGVYEKLIHSYQKGFIDFSEVITFNLDEYYPMEKLNPQSYHQYMHNRLFKHININEKNINILNGEALDPMEECKRYEKAIEACGGIDLQLLGIGVNGHIGFNEPGEAFQLETHLVELHPDTIDANSRFFEDKEKVPRKALTVGMKAIMEAKKIILLASGKNKEKIIKELIKENVTSKLPATILKLHSDCTLIITP